MFTHNLHFHEKLSLKLCLIQENINKNFDPHKETINKFENHQYLSDNALDIESLLEFWLCFSIFGLTEVAEHLAMLVKNFFK